MRSLEITWQLYKQSFAVLSADLEILLFPLLSSVSAILLAAGFFYPMYLDGTLKALANKQGAVDHYGILFLWYYLNYFIMIFFNAALVACANKRLSGGDPTVGDGFRGAIERIISIAVWAFVASTVGMVLNSLRNRKNLLSTLVGATLGLSWTLITYLVIPVIVVEGLSVSNAIHRSAQLFRKNWGEQVAGNFGFGLVTLLFCLPAILVGMLLWPVDKLFAVILGFVYYSTLMMVCSAVKGVFTVALYRHASHNGLPEGFSGESIDRILGQPRSRWE